MNSFSVSGPSIYYSNVTLNSSLNVSGSTTLKNDTTLVTNLDVSGTTYCYGHLFAQQNGC
jgi:hypothetical protein